MSKSRRTRWTASAILAGAVLAAAGGCTPYPDPVWSSPSARRHAAIQRASAGTSCNTLGFAEVPANASPVRTGNASVIPPARWCYGPPNTPVFINLGVIGPNVPMQPSPEQMANTFLALLVRIEQPEGAPVDADTLPAFVEQWTSYANNRTLGSAGQSRPSLSLDRRFTVATRQVEPAARPGAVACQRYRMTVFETGNPRLPNETLEIHDEGLICLATGAPGALYLASYSERFLKGRQVDAERSRQLARDSGQPFLASLAFDN